MRIRDLLDRLSRQAHDDEGDSHWIVDDAARARLRAAVTAFDHAPIFTIHGFCHRILVEDAFASQRLFQQTQVADEVAFDAAFKVVLREQFAYVSPDKELLEAFMASGRTVRRLRDLLLSCARIGIDARLKRRLDGEALRAAVATFREHFGTESRRNIVAAALLSEKHWATNRIAEIAEALDETPPDASAPQLLAMLDRCREAVDLIAKRANKLSAPIVNALRGVLTTMSLDEACAATMLPAILARVQADKQEHGLFDYDDMLHLVWRALVGPRGTELAARLRERTPWAMIDEFQDTDPVQWNIFRTVWMHDNARGLTIVGDPKQAIYSFRGADVKTYLLARDEMLRAGATRVPLAVNRRSTEALVTAVNKILIGNVYMPLLSGDITYDEPVRASGDVICHDPRPPITVLAVKGTKASVDQNRMAIARAIGDAIEGLRARPPSWSSRGAIRPFLLGQVMVLTRTNRDSTEIAAALRARGLPCALVEPERLFATREAAELSCVLAAIAEPRDRSARLRALRTRFFDVPWADLMNVVDAPDHHPLIARLFDWSQLAARRAYETLFRRLVEDSHYAERALVLGGGERAVTNTWHLLELLLAELSHARSDLHELVARLRRWMFDEQSHPDERDVQRAETEADAIRILTIHKAKGLEAPYVFVYGGLSGGPKGQVRTLRDPVGRLIIVGEHDDSTQAMIDAETEQENQRLAYVALTRAQVRLYLPFYADLKKDATYSPVQRCVGPLIARNHANEQRLFEVVELPVDTPPLPEPPLDALATFVAPPPPTQLAELAPLPLPRAGLVMLSYTRLAHDLELPMTVAKPGEALAIDPAEFDIDDASNKIDAAPLVGPDDLPPGADSGLLLHDVLEVADLAHARASADALAWSRDPDVEHALLDAARARGTDPRYLPHAVEVLYRTLTRPLALTDGHTLPSLVDARSLAREVEFAFPLDMIDAASSAANLRNRGFVRGFMDALVAWDDDELWVLDYKSDALAGPDFAAAARHRVDEHYAVQARLYSIAAERMRGRRRFAGMLFQFMRHDLVVPWRVDEPMLEQWNEWLARIARRPYVDSKIEVQR